MKINSYYVRFITYKRKYRKRDVLTNKHTYLSTYFCTYVTTYIYITISNLMSVCTSGVASRRRVPRPPPEGLACPRNGDPSIY